MATVFAFLFLTMLMGMVINLGRHVDRKVKVQNAADAATYSGATVVARSMNTLTFTNFLLCDVFALTAYLREARDRNADTLSDPVLDAWDEVAPEFRDAPLPKFQQLERGIPLKTELERQLIDAWSNHNAAISETLLPVVEEILGMEMIPEFQRALIETTPNLANIAANEIAGRHGPVGRGLNGRTAMNALMWRTDAMPFGSETSTGLSQMPAADPVNDWTQYQSFYFDESSKARAEHSFRFLRSLNNEMLLPLEARLQQGRNDKFVPAEKFYGGWGYHNGAAKLSQFSQLWRGFTQAQLKQLLEVEYPFRNLPMVILRDDQQENDLNGYLEKDFMFVGATYWSAMQERMPGLFYNPLQADQMAFAQAQLFIPRGRFIQDTRYFGDPQRQWRFSAGPSNRDLWNQNWAVQLVPATSQSIPSILQTPPPEIPALTPNLGGLTVEDFRRINTH
ncbi:MAG: Tad domain-containing protein [Mariniblastus sp.]|nr:Tad domain-containing protein [Mariniblastus sp.]